MAILIFFASVFVFMFLFFGSTFIAHELICDKGVIAHIFAFSVVSSFWFCVLMVLLNKDVHGLLL